MTLCIAAFASSGWSKDEDEVLTDIVMCSDLRVETSETGSETGFKMKKLGDNWAVMFAGDVSRADELYSIYRADLPTDPIPQSDLLDVLRIPPQKLKRRLSEQYVQTTLAIPYDEFINKGNQVLPSSLFENMMTEIARMEIGCQMILIPAGNQKRTDFYCVELDGSVFQQDNFCAIGSGSPSANAWLHYREQSKFSSLSETVCALVEAKKFCENAPGVGKRVHINIIMHDGAFLMANNESALTKAIWAKTGPRRIRGIKIDTEKDFTSSKWAGLGVG